MYMNHLFGASNIDYGAQRWTIGNTFIHVLPSTSGAANRYWDEASWFALAREVKTV